MTESTCCSCCCWGCSRMLLSPPTSCSGARVSQAGSHVGLCQGGGVGGDAARTVQHGAHAHVSPESQRQGRTTRTMNTAPNGHCPTAIQVTALTCTAACCQTTPTPSRRTPLEQHTVLTNAQNRLPNPAPAPVPTQPSAHTISHAHADLLSWSRWRTTSAACAPPPVWQAEWGTV